jgi:hypothetical protein
MGMVMNAKGDAGIGFHFRILLRLLCSMHLVDTRNQFIKLIAKPFGFSQVNFFTKRGKSIHSAD